METGSAIQISNVASFHSSVGVDDVFAVFADACSKSMEWSVPMWCPSLDLQKSFDRIQYNALFEALKAHGVPHACLKLLVSSYQDQLRLVRGKQFPINAV